MTFVYRPEQLSAAIAAIPRDMAALNVRTDNMHVRGRMDLSSRLS